MKKNITINLYGALYAIDEDAYAMLERYLENMKRYFSRAEGGDEIADDVERRVAELFAELQEQGVEAITIEHVSSIIQRIGNPEDMTEDAASAGEWQNEESEASEAAADAEDWQTEQHVQHTQTNRKQKAGAWFSSRKLYRDADDKLLGGVMSGLCHYFGGTDPLPWRLLMVLLLFVSFSFVGVLYLLAWALVPAARTDEERLRMCGRPVTPQNINEEMMHRMQPQPAVAVQPQRSGIRAFFYTLVRIIVVIIKVVILLCAGGTFVGLLIFFGGLLFTLYGGADAMVHAHTLTQLEYNVLQHNPGIVCEIFISLIGAFLALLILIGSIVVSLVRRAESKPMSASKRITLIVIFLLSSAASLTFCAMAAIQMDAAKDVEKRKLYTDAQGFYITPDSRSYLEREGWTVNVAENCNKDGEWYAKTFSFDEDGYGLPYLSVHNADETKPMRFNVTKTAQLPAGYYRLEAITRCDSKKVCIGYWNEDNTSLYATLCPGYDVNGKGNLKQMGYQWAMSTKLFAANLTEKEWNEKVENDVDDWSYSTTAPFYFAGGTLRYGFMNDKGVDGSNATSAEILKLEVVPVDAPTSSAPTAPAIKVTADSSATAAKNGTQQMVAHK